MISIKELDKNEVDLCFKLDLDTICLWSQEQWESEFNKKGVKVFGLLMSDKIIGVCVVQVIIDEAQINYFSIDRKFRRRGYGCHLMKNLINHCEVINVKKLLLEVSDTNTSAKKFYSQFKFLTVGRRKNFYKDGSDAVLKEKILIK